MIKFFKRQLLKFLLVLMLLLPKCSFSQPVNIVTGQADIVIIDNETKIDILQLTQDFEISGHVHKEKEKHRFNIDSVCLDLFDYSILKGHLLSLEEEFKTRIDLEKKICDDSIDLLNEKFNERIVVYKDTIKKLNNDILDLNESFKKKEELHSEELKIWKWTTISVSTVSLILLYGLVK